VAQRPRAMDAQDSYESACLCSQAGVTPAGYGKNQSLLDDWERGAADRRRFGGVRFGL
jgi:hypothetical protein